MYTVKGYRCQSNIVSQELSPLHSQKSGDLTWDILVDNDAGRNKTRAGQKFAGSGVSYSSDILKK